MLFIANSASLALEEDGERLNDLYAVLFFVAQVVRLFNDDVRRDLNISCNV